MEKDYRNSVERFQDEYKNIEKFKKLHYYRNGSELTPEEITNLFGKPDWYESLDECADKCAYDLSNDWARMDDVSWNDVREAYKMGAYAGIEYERNREKELGND